jgi:dTDP-4-amino-4,6-dideoxygalactose transaminase
MINVASPIIGRGEIRAVRKVLRSKNLAGGLEVDLFEKNFSHYLSNLDCIAVNSGTSALYLSLMAAGIKAGDEVIVPSFTFAATANVILLLGAKPIFVDISEESYNLDPSKIEEKISNKTKGIIVVHLYGNPADLVAINDLCIKYNLMLFEDAAQAHGAEIEGKRVGTWGLCNSFSFYPTKNMTTGEGGLISTKDSTIARNIRLLRNQGMFERYKNEIAGFNLRMSDIHAAIGNVQFRKLEKFNEKRIKNATFYSKHLENIIIPKYKSSNKHVFHQYTIRIPHLIRSEVMGKLLENGISCGVYYPIPVNKLKAFSTNDHLPVTDKVTKECFSIPVHPNLMKSQISKIVEVLNKIAKEKI